MNFCLQDRNRAGNSAREDRCSGKYASEINEPPEL